MPASKPLEIKMTKVRETKGTFVYEADDDTMPVTGIYFKKAGVDKVGGTAPEKITVTVEVS
jgi:hypothetical protein